MRPALVFVILAFLASCGRARQTRAVDTTQLQPKGGGAAGHPRMSPDGLQHIREDEGFVARVYDDGVGNQTIGYGHMLQPGESFVGGLTEPKARDILAGDVSRIVNPELDRITVPLTQEQVDALGDFIFNVGPGNFARYILPALNAKNFTYVADHMAKFTGGTNHRTGELVMLRGLVQRRLDEVKEFEGQGQGTSSAWPPGESLSASRRLASLDNSRE